MKLYPHSVTLRWLILRCTHRNGTDTRHIYVIFHDNGK